MPSPIRIGLLNGLIYRPIVLSLQRSSACAEELVFGGGASHIEQLMNGALDAAFLTPMEYAMHSSDLQLVPGIAVSSSGMSGIIRLYLRSTLKEIATLAVNRTTSSEVALARLVLTEKHDSAPAIVPVNGTVSMMLEKADTALIVGDDVLAELSDQPFLDLVDEWNDISELPYVHAVCVIKAGKEKGNIVELLQQAVKEEAITALEVARQVPDTDQNLRERVVEQLSYISHSFHEDHHTSLQHFFQMAFYQGMLGDVPDLNFA